MLNVECSVLNVERKQPARFQHPTSNIQHSTLSLLRRLIVLCSLLATPAFAQLSLGGATSAIPGQDLVKLTGSVNQKDGAVVHGAVTATILNGWHINSNKPLDDFVIPSALSFDAATADLVSADYPPHTVRSFKFSGAQKLAVFEGTIQIPFTARLKSGNTINGKLHYQACNDTVCLPPRDAEVTIDASVVSASAAPAATPAASSGFTPLSAAPKGPAAAPIGNDQLSATYAAHGLPLTLLVLFLGGLALNLTPCVFPMIPITVGFFAMQSDGRRSRRFALSLSYVIGIVITYSVLGVFAALSGRMFGSWLQSPAVLIGFAVLMLVLASSMFGVWEFRVPQFIANRSAGRAGVAGALTMGLFVGIVAAPCVGPVVVALFTLVAGIAKPAIGIAMFATLAFGLGFPYLIALNAMPKPGEWMVQVKKAMGFVLIGMAFYFLRAVIGETGFRVGVAASLLIGAVFLFASRGPRGRIMRLACATILLLAGVAFAIPPRKGVAVQWQKYDAAAVTASAGKPIVIDFFATWCIPCKELDEKTFGDAGVARDLDRFTRIKADVTNDKDPAVQELTKRYSIVGVPTVILIDSSGHEQQQLRLTGFEKPEQFLARIQQVK
jgi:thiol:disulfide interchange protein DsbD